MNKNHKLDECLHTIMKTFHETQNKYEAHLKCYPILHTMASDDAVIHEIFKRQLASKSLFSEEKHTPDFQINLIDSPECFLFVNFFGPNQDKRTDISYSTMHHHDDYILSTINAKGHGYKSAIFKQGYEIDKNKMTAVLEIDKYVLHSLGNIEFIDCHTAHTIFYPSEMTMTYGLWSNHKSTPQTSKAKQNPLIQTNKRLIKKLLESFKINPRSLGVQQYREDYFCPQNGVLEFLPGQILPPQGKNFVQNFYHVLQDFLHFPDKIFLKDLYTTNPRKLDLELDFIDKIISNEPIERTYNTYDMYFPKRNVSIEEYRKCFDINLDD